MTEAEWLACDDPEKMLVFLRGPATTEMRDVRGWQIPCAVYLDPRASDRKLRLFAVACCRCLSRLLPSKACHHAMEVAERYADHLATDAELTDANSEVGKEATLVFNAAGDAVRTNPSEAHDKAMHAIHGHGAVLAASAHSLVNADNAAGNALAHMPDQDRAAGRLTQCALLRDLTGPVLFRPITLDSTWLTSTVVAIATQMYESRDFGAMPILADALQDAGCDSDDVLNHCRGAAATHVRGCWVVDLVLGKE